MKTNKERIEKLEEDMIFWKKAVIEMQEQHMRLQKKFYEHIKQEEKK